MIYSLIRHLFTLITITLKYLLKIRGKNARIVVLYFCIYNLNQFEANKKIYNITQDR